MAEKSKEQLQAEIQLRDALDRERAANDAKLEKERRTSDGKYSIKLIEKIVFWFIAICAGATLTALIKLAVEHIHFGS